MPARSFRSYAQEIESPETAIPQDEGATLAPVLESQSQESPFSIPDPTGDDSNQPAAERGNVQDDIFSTGLQSGDPIEGEATVLVTPDGPSKPIVEESFLGSPSFWFLTIPLLLIPFVIYALMNSMSRRKARALPEAEPAIEVNPEQEVRGQFKKAERFHGEKVDRQSFDQSLDEFDQGQLELQDGQVLRHLAHANREFGSDRKTYRTDESPVTTKAEINAELETRRILIKPAGEHGGDLYLEVSFQLDQSDPKSSLDNDEEFDYSAEVEEIKRVWETANPAPVALSDEPSHSDSFDDSSDISDSGPSGLRASVGAFASDADQLWRSHNDFDSEEDLDDDSASDLDHVMGNERLTIDGAVVNNEDLENEINSIERNDPSLVEAEDSGSISDDDPELDLSDDDSDLELNFDVDELEAKNSDSMEDDDEIFEDSESDLSELEGSKTADLNVDPSDSIGVFDVDDQRVVDQALSADDQQTTETHGLATSGVVAGAVESSSMFGRIFGWMKRTPPVEEELGDASTAPTDETAALKQHTAQPDPADFALGAPASIASESADESDAVEFGSDLNFDDSAEVKVPNLDLDDEDFPMTEGPASSADTLRDSESKLDDHSVFKSAETLRAPEIAAGLPKLFKSKDTLNEDDASALMKSASSADTLQDGGSAHEVQFQSLAPVNSADPADLGFEKVQLLNLQSRIDELEKANHVLTASLNNQHSEAEQANQAQVDSLKQENDRLVQALETKEAESQSLEKSLSQAPKSSDLDEFTAKLEAAELAKSELQTEFDSLKLAIEQLKSTQEAADLTTEKREVEFTELQSKLETASVDNEELDSTRLKLANTQAELDSAKSELPQIAELQSKLEAASKENETLETTRVQLTNTQAELESAKSELPQIAELQSKLDVAFKENESLESTQVELKESQTELESARTDLENAKSELHSIRAKFEQQSESGTLSDLSSLGDLNSNPASDASKTKITVERELLERFEKRLKAEYKRRKEVQACLDQAEQQRDEAAAALRLARRDSNSSAESETTRPAAESRSTKKDDLTRITGIGPKIKKKLFNNGVTSFDQIANWIEQDVNKFEEILSMRNRIGSENWVGQAKDLVNARKNS